MSLPTGSPVDPHGLVGTVLDGRYRIDAYLSGGGMGDVYRAVQLSLNRTVALKLLKQDLSGQPEMAQRFAQEALALSRLDHPNVVRVIDFAQDWPDGGGGRAYLVMELVEGEPLERLLKQEREIEPARTVAILTALCDALEMAHAVGIVHRDLKPENVVLAGPGRDVPKILDFGIARFTAGAGQTQIGMVLGTPEYMSPEQALGQAVDGRSDLYSLSVMAYRMLCGRLPFEAAEPRDLLMMHVNAPPPELASRSEALGRYPALCAAVMRGLAKSPEARYATAAELKAALQAGLTPVAGGTGTQQMFQVSPPTHAQGGTRPITRATSLIGPRTATARTANVAIMFTAIDGIEERTSRQTPEQNAEMHAHYEAIVLPVVRGFGGRKIKSVSDGMLLTFGSPSNAVLCGAAIQDRLWHFNRQARPEQRFEIRIAASLGEVRLEDGDVFGEPVNIAARVREVAAPGQVVFTDAIYLAMNRALVTTEELGTESFKGIPNPVRLYRVRAEVAGEGPPFGGAALKKLGRLPNPLGRQLFRERLKEARSHARRAVALARAHPREAIAGGALLLALLLATLVVGPRLSSPLRKAEGLLNQKQPKAALMELEQIREALGEDAGPEEAPKKWAALHALEARARFANGEYDAAFAAAKKAAELDPGALRDEELRVLADLLDLERFRSREALITLLSTRIGRRAEEHVRLLVGAKRVRTRNDALDVLERIGRAKDADRLAVVTADLEEKKLDCVYRRLAAKRLETIGTEQAITLLQKMAGERTCGRTEAREALRRLNRSNSGE